MLEKQVDLFVLRQRDRYRLVEFIAPNPFRTVRDEGAVAVVAVLQTLFGILAFSNVGGSADDLPHTAICVSRKNLVTAVKPAPRTIVVAHPVFKFGSFFVVQIRQPA